MEKDTTIQGKNKQKIDVIEPSDEHLKFFEDALAVFFFFFIWFKSAIDSLS